MQNTEGYRLHMNINFLKSKKIWLFFSFIILVFSYSAQAETYMVVANTGLIDSTYDVCTFSSSGKVYNDGTSSACRVYFSIPGYVASTLTSITLYYYDTSGSQYMSAYLKKQDLDSTSSASSVASKVDTTTSTSIQSSTMTISSTISDSYSYYVYVTLKYGTALRGLVIEY